MPSDLNTQIAQITEIFTKLDSGTPLLEDAHTLFELGAGLKIKFEQAENAAKQLKTVFDTVRSKAKEMVENSPQEIKDASGNPIKLQGGTLKPRTKRNDQIEEIRAKFVDSKNTRDAQLSLLLNFGEPIADNTEPSSNKSLSAGGQSTSNVTSGTGKGEDEGAVQMERFFTSVTESLIGAQKQLNQQSLEYAAQLDRRLQPAHYAIPSLKAEMKVGFSESKTKGMNLILFSSKQQRESYGESTLSFELVSVPPPPGSDRPEPPPGFLLVGEEKKRFLNRVHELAKAEQLEVKLTANFDTGKALASILRYSEKTGETKYLVFWPSQTEKDLERENFWRNMLVLHFSEAEGKLEPDTSVFDKNFFPKLEKNNQYLLIPDTAGLNNLTPEKLVALINCFGDAVFKTLTIFDEYYKAWRPEPKPPAAE